MNFNEFCDILKSNYLDFDVSGVRVKTLIITSDSRLSVMYKIKSMFDDVGIHSTHIDKKSTIGCLEFKLDVIVHVVIKPIEYAKDWLLNELGAVEIFNELNSKYNSVILESKTNRFEYVFDGAIKAPHAKGRDKDGKIFKADVLLNYKRSNIPLSLKLPNAAIWESADASLRDVVRESLKELIDHHEISNFEFSKMNSDILISHDIPMKNFVFGDDILKRKGSIVVNNFIKPNVEKNVIYVDELFTKWSQVKSHVKYKPDIMVKKMTGRNKTDELLKDASIVVANQYRCKSAKSIKDLKSLKLKDIYKVEC